MTERDEKILRHIGLYRLSLRAVISRHFFDDGNPGNVLQRLKDGDRIRYRQGLSGRLSYYQLTPQEATVRFQSTKRAQPLKGQSLNANLAILWFCCMADKKRERLEKAHLVKLFQDEAPSGPHCLEGGDSYCVLRLFPASAKTNNANLIARVQHYLQRASQQPPLDKWVTNRQYGFAILVETRERVESLQNALSKLGFDKKARFAVEQVPGPQTIRRALNDIRKLR